MSFFFRIFVISAILSSFPLPSSFPRRRESTRRRAANADGALRHLTGRGFYIPVILATAGIHRRDSGDIIALAIIAAFLLFARSANHLAKQDGKMRLFVAPPLAAEITGGFAAAGGLPFSAINRRLRFRANSKMAKGWIPAYAGMTGI